MKLVFLEELLGAGSGEVWQPMFLIFMRRVRLLASFILAMSKLYSKTNWGTSLVAQWLRIRLSMQGTRVRALVREDPTCSGATKPMHHNYWACALELMSHNYWARAPRARAPQQEKPPQWEARAPQRRVALAHHSYRKPMHRNEDPMQPKIN